MTVFLRGNRQLTLAQQQQKQHPSSRSFRLGFDVGGSGGGGGGIVSGRFRWISGIAALVVLVIVFLILPHHHHLHPTGSDLQQQQQRRPGLRRPKGTLIARNPISVRPLSPTRIPDTDIFYLLPPEAKTIQGLLLFFHGCQHTGGADFFILPEDRIVAYEAVNRHSLIAVGLTSSDRRSGCWDESDLPRIQNEIQTLTTHLQKEISSRPIQHDHAISKLPKYGMGASSGAAFIIRYATKLQLTSLAAYVPPRGALDSISTSNMPPLIVVHMPKDIRNAESINAWVERHRSDNKETASDASSSSLEIEVLEVQPHAFTQPRCEERLPELTKETCKTLIEQAKKASSPRLMDEEGFILDGHMVLDEWARILKSLDLADDADTANKSGIPEENFSSRSWKWAAVQEELQVAFGRHEMTAEHCTTVLNFLQGHESR